MYPPPRESLDDALPADIHSAARVAPFSGDRHWGMPRATSVSVVRLGGTERAASKRERLLPSVYEERVPPLETRLARRRANFFSVLPGEVTTQQLLLLPAKERALDGERKAIALYTRRKLVLYVRLDTKPERSHHHRHAHRHNLFVGLESLGGGLFPFLEVTRHWERKGPEEEDHGPGTIPAAAVLLTLCMYCCVSHRKQEQIHICGR